MADPYISKKTVDASYRPKSNQMSPGLQRAREPFRLRNAVTGIILMSFAVGVWAYSIGAVKQDEFHDVDEEARELARSGAQVKSLEDEAKELAVQTTAKSVSAPIIPLATTPPVPTVVPGDRPRGVVASLLYERYPQLLDPASKTLVWGAPPVDNIGKFRIGSRR